MIFILFSQTKEIHWKNEEVSEEQIKAFWLENEGKNGQMFVVNVIIIQFFSLNDL